MGFLDGGFLGGGGGGGSQVQTQSTTSAPWSPQQPYLKEIFQGAQTAYQSDAPSYFPESTVVDQSPQTLQALQGIEQRAQAGSPLQQQAMQQAQNTVQGDYLNDNQFLQGAIQNAQQPMIDQWQNQIAPGIDSSFSGAGRMGSGLYAQARNQSEDTLARGLGQVGQNMAYQNYGDERGRQQQMIQQAPGMAQSDYSDLGQLMNVGASREQQQGLQMQDQINRYNFEQNRPWEQLAKYSGMVGGGFGSEGTQASPLYNNTAANFLGGALGGAQLGGQFGQSGYGALAGGLLGAMG